MDDIFKSIDAPPVIDWQFSDRRRWPKASSAYVNIFEAIDLVGRSLYGEAWTGAELSARVWNEKLEKRQREHIEYLRKKVDAPFTLAPKNSGGGAPGSGRPR